MNRSSSTLPLFLAGRSCGECLLLASDLDREPERDVMLRAVRGLAAGRGVTCTLLLAGLLALGARSSPTPPPRAPATDLLDSFKPPGGPGASEVQDLAGPEEFQARFEELARREHGDMTCAAISGIDWGRRDAGGAPAGYPPEQCVQMADAALDELNRILASQRR